MTPINSLYEKFESILAVFFRYLEEFNRNISHKIESVEVFLDYLKAKEIKDLSHASNDDENDVFSFKIVHNTLTISEIKFYHIRKFISSLMPFYSKAM